MVQQRGIYLAGPLFLVQGYWAIFAHLAVFVENVDRNERFGLNFDILDFDCNICYNASTREKVWGTVTTALLWDELKTRVVRLETGASRYPVRFALSSISRGTASDSAASYRKTTIITSAVPLKGSKKDIALPAVTIKLYNLEWMLEAETAFVLVPVWRAPLLALVIAVAFLSACMAIHVLVNDKHREVLLHAILPPKVLMAMKDGEQFIEEYQYVGVLVSKPPLLNQYIVLSACLFAEPLLLLLYPL